METLRGGLWHTTSVARFAGIKSHMAILSQPPVPDAERWGTACGPNGWPFVRTLGGVSLFDFEGFDPEEHDVKCPMSSWREFVPFRAVWGASVWIEIDRLRAGESLVGPRVLLARQSRDRAYGHRLMPYIEACYLRDLSAELFVRALMVGSGGAAFRLIDL